MSSVDASLSDIAPEGLVAADFRALVEGLQLPARIRVSVQHIPSGKSTYAETEEQITYADVVDRIRLMMSQLDLAWRLGSVFTLPPKTEGGGE